MARRTRDELVEIVTKYIGDRTDDESISLLEDITDSFATDDKDWKAEYERNDREWREKYLSRFRPTNTGAEESVQEDVQEEQRDEADTPPENMNFEDLF